MADERRNKSSFVAEGTALQSVRATNAGSAEIDVHDLGASHSKAGERMCHVASCLGGFLLARFCYCTVSVTLPWCCTSPKLLPPHTVNVSV